MEPINIQITILANKQNEMYKAFESLKRAAKKFGVEEPTIHYSPVYSKEILVKEADYDEKTMEVSEFFDVMDVTIGIASMFKLNGDYIVHSIINHETGNIFIVNVEDDLPAQYTDTQNTHCDHCNQKRSRTKSFILKDSQNHFIKVGKSCMKQFVGLNPESFVSALNYLNEFREETEQYVPFKVKGPASRMNTAHNMDLVITLASKLISKEGYIRKLYSDDRFHPFRINAGKATGDKLEDMLFDRDVVLSTTTDTKLVAKIRHYFENLPETRQVTYRNEEGEKINDEFENQLFISLKKLTGRTKVRLIEAMTIAAGVNAYYNNLEREAKLAQDRLSNWVGQPGTKMELRLTLESVVSDYGQYGRWFLWSFRDENGNIFKKFGQLNQDYIVTPGTGESLYDFNEGDIFEFTAEIKEHSTYKDIKTTMLGRLSKFKSKKKVK